ncbi:MAG: hypothetical protein NVS9B10_20600 [Nevskia sp.]
MRAFPLLIPILLALLLAGCTASRITRGDGPSIAAARAENAKGAKYRIAVGNIVDRSGPTGDKSLAVQIGYVNAKRKAEEQIQASSITSGIRDLLTTELFNSAQFIVLERDALNEAIVEQEFSQSARVGDATRIPKAQLEGAELLVVGALTGFDAGVQGGAIPIPVPLGKFSNGIGIVNLSFKRGFAAMDLRVIDSATGRVVASTAVEGRNSSYGLGLGGLFTGRTGYIPLPGVLDFFSNTPVEQALQKMVIAAIGEITKQQPSKLPVGAVLAAPAPAPAPAPPAAASAPTPASKPAPALKSPPAKAATPAAGK